MTHILLLDDDDGIRDSLARLLNMAGFTIATAGNGRDGLREFAIRPADLVITDVLMPEMDGVETLLRLRELAPNLPILAISGGWVRRGGNERLDPLDFIGKLGATAVLPKPFDCDDLLASIDRCLSASPSLSEESFS
jgi:DNA-binding response OmpR family regulator